MNVHINNMSAGYDRHPIVHHLNGVFTDASMTAVVGPNGGGKSTLLKALVGFVPLMTGSIDLSDATTKKIAYLPQQFEIDRTFPISVMDVVLMGLWPRLGAWGRIHQSDKQEALQVLSQVDMAAFAEWPIVSLSTGQWQRTLFARLSLQRASLILLDEPFAAIDSRTTRDLLRVMADWQQMGKTIICVMHDFKLVHEYFPQTIVLARELIAWGKTTDVLCEENLSRAATLMETWVDDEICKIGDRVA